MNIFERGGVLIIEGLFAPNVFSALQEDARERRATATRHVFDGPNEEEWRGGQPARAHWASGAGPLQFQMFGNPSVVETLSRVCEVPVEVSGAGSYSYYCEPGDYLALHRDILRCDIATITCLDDDGPEVRGGLCVYPEYLNRPLSEIRRDRPPAVAVPCRPGQTIILAGGLIPHEVSPAVPGQRRTVALSCYKTVL